jgi:hypothetical protein
MTPTSYPWKSQKKWINGHYLQRRKYNLHICIMQRRMHGPDNWWWGDLWMVRTKEGWSNIIIKWDNPTLPLMLIIIQLFYVWSQLNYFSSDHIISALTGVQVLQPTME